MSIELCEHNEQPVSTQRGGNAASPNADTNKGKLNVENRSVHCSPVEPLDEKVYDQVPQKKKVFLCYKPTAPPGGH